MASAAIPVVIVSTGPVFADPATPIMVVSGRPVLAGPATPMQVVAGRPVLAGPATPVTSTSNFATRSATLAIADPPRTPQKLIELALAPKCDPHERRAARPAARDRARSRA